MPKIARASLETDWRRKLQELEDLLLMAHDVDELVQVQVLMCNLLAHALEMCDASAIDGRANLPVQLVREAFDLLSNPASEVDKRDWLKAAAPFVRS